MFRSLLLLLVLSSFQGRSQFAIDHVSTPFKVKKFAYAKLLFFKNGNTVYFDMDPRHGFAIKIFNSKHELMAQKEISIKKQGRERSIEACVEVNGDLVVLCKHYDYYNPQLDRYIFSGKNGDLLSRENIYTLNKLGSESIGLQGGTLPVNNFRVSYSPETEHYSVANINENKKTSNQEISTLVFGKDHKEIYRQKIIVPNDEYKYARFIDIKLANDNSVYLLIHAFNKMRKEGMDANLLWIKSNSESNEQDVWSINEKSSDISGFIQYNPIIKEYLIFYQAVVNRKSPFFSNKTTYTYQLKRKIYNPMSNKIKELDFPGFSSIYEKVKDKYDDNVAFDVLLQNCIVDEKGNYSILFEGQPYNVNHSVSGMGSSSLTVSQRLGNIAVIHYNKNHELISTAFIPKLQQMNNTTIGGGSSVSGENVYHYQRNLTGWQYRYGNEFKSFVFLPGKNKILMNDILINERRKNEKPKLFEKMKKVKSYSFNVTPDEIMPTRQSFFDAKTSSKSYAAFAISAFQESTGLYATIVRDEKSSKKYTICWGKID